SSLAALDVNGGAVGISSLSMVTVDSNVTLSGDNNMTIITPQLNLSSSAVVQTTGASSSIYITSQTGSTLTINSPAGSSATIQTPFAATNNVDSFGRFTEKSIGTINIVPGSPAGFDPSALDFSATPTPTLTFSCSGCTSTNNLTTTLSLTATGTPPTITEITVFTLTTGAATTIQPGVTVNSNGHIVMHINNGTLINYGTLQSSASADVFYRTIDIFAYNGSLTLAGNGGTFGVDGIATKGNQDPVILFNTFGDSPITIEGSCTFNLLHSQNGNSRVSFANSSPTDDEVTNPALISPTNA